ncbi:hypothetical protein [Streptomyces sp. NPDC051994]|uniref:hypothetical protein n=1 Tax=unclassified Streptomyces TaxID=2593676 RepID=UPI0034408A8A
MTTPTNPIERLDVPTSRLTADVKALLARQRLAVGRAAEAHHLIDPLDHDFERLAVEHPEACTTDASYPGWADCLAELVAKSEATRKRTPGGAS